MALGAAWLVVDARDAGALARFWAEVLGYELDSEQPESQQEVAIRPRDGNGLHILFGNVDDVKREKNRLHLDLRPDDQQREVQRLLDLGASKTDVGQGDDVTWVVMADPEGNEFCVLRPLRDDERGP